MAVLEQSKAVCQTCGEALEGTWSQCPSCGSSTGTGIACPSCGRTVKPNWRSCPDCHAALEGEKTPTGPGKSGRAGSGDLAKKGRQNVFVTHDDAGMARPGELPNLTGKELGGRYKIEGHLGTGGFGAVYAALDGGTRQKIALKIVVAPTDSEESEHAIQQILQEYRLRQKINDFTHVVRCDDPRTCELNGLSLILLPMEIAPEGSFRNWLLARPDKDKRQAEALNIFRQACEGVKAIHQAGQVHLDLKPENILIKDGNAKIADFGIGRFASLAAGCNPDQLVRAGMGTPRYMSPEQFETARQQDIGTSSDVYGLGVILFEILDGATPFDGSRTELQHKHKSTPPPPLKGAAAAWARIVDRCLAKSPDQRYPSVDALITDLDRLQLGAATSVDVSCPNCGHINANPEHKVCGNCQTLLKDHFQACPTCAKDVRKDVETCPGCGEAILAHYVRVAQWRRYEQLKDEDPVEAIALLEKMIRDGGKGANERCVTELKDLRKIQTRISQLIAEAGRATVDGQFQEALSSWREVLRLAPRHRVGVQSATSVDSLLREFGACKVNGLSLIEQADFEQGTRQLQRCIELIPKNDEVKRSLLDVPRRANCYSAAMEAARSHQDAKQVAAALEHARLALREAPRSREARDICAELEATIQATDELLKAATQKLRNALFEEAERDLCTVEECRLDVDGLDARRVELHRQRDCFLKAMTETDHAHAARDLAVALAKAHLAQNACPDSLIARARLKAIGDDQERASAHLKKAKCLLLAADFEGATQELEHAKGLWISMPGLAETGANLTSTHSAYYRHMANAERALAKKAFDEGRAACQEAFAACSESQGPKQLYRRINDEEAAEKSRQEKNAERARRRRAMLWRAAKFTFVAALILAALGTLAWLAVKGWNQVRGSVSVNAVWRTNVLLTSWGVLLFITSCVHRARYTNLYSFVLSNVFGMRSDRMFAANVVVAFLLTALAAAPAAGAYYIAENYFEWTTPASIKLGLLCAVITQIITAIDSVARRCRYRLV